MLLWCCGAVVVLLWCCCVVVVVLLWCCCVLWLRCAGFFSVQSDSLPTRTRTTNPANPLTNRLNHNNIHHTTFCSDKASRMSRYWQAPSRDLTSKPHCTVPKEQSTRKQRRGRPWREPKELQQFIQKSLRGAFPRSRGEPPMAALFPTNMTKPAVISTNRARNKPTESTRQGAKRPHHGTNETTRAPNINAWTNWNSRH